LGDARDPSGDRKIKKVLNGFKEPVKLSIKG